MTDAYLDDNIGGKDVREIRYIYREEQFVIHWRLSCRRIKIVEVYLKHPGLVYNYILYYREMWDE